MASAPHTGQDSCWSHWSPIPKHCHGKGAQTGHPGDGEGSRAVVIPSAVSVPDMDLVVNGCGVISVLLWRWTHTGRTGSWVPWQVCDVLGREPFLDAPGSVPWPSSALLIPIKHIPRNIPRQPLCPSPSRCFSLSPLSTFSPARPSSSLSFLSHPRAQPFLFHVHHPH